MSFLDEPPGTILVQFDDGSAYVRGNGTPEEAETLRQLLHEQLGDDDPAAEGLARTLLENGLTLSSPVAPSSDPRTMGGETFKTIADAIGRTN